MGMQRLGAEQQHRICQGGATEKVYYTCLAVEASVVGFVPALG